MKNMFLIAILALTSFAAKAQTSITVTNNTTSSVCSLRVYFSYYDKNCGFTTASSETVISNGSSTTINLTTLTWSPSTPSYLLAPVINVFYPNSNNVPCSGTARVGGGCFANTAQLVQCHPSCTNANVTYDPLTATVTIAP